MNSILFAILAALPAWHGDVEDDFDRYSRLETVALAIEEAVQTADWPGESDELAVLLVTQAYMETRLAYHVHAGKCRPKECDNGRAASLWQLQYGAHLPQNEWERLKGIDYAATLKSAKLAAKYLSMGRRKCGSNAGAISLYATGRTCSWPGARHRIRLHERLLSEFRKQMHQKYLDVDS